MSRVILPPDVEPMLALDQEMTVYTVGASGAYTETALAAEPCRLVRVREQGTGLERVELAALRRLLWDGVYQLPETAQIEVESERFNIMAGTVAYLRGPSSAVEYGRAEVVRVQ